MDKAGPEKRIDMKALLQFEHKPQFTNSGKI